MGAGRSHPGLAAVPEKHGIRQAEAASNYKWVANYARYDDPAWYSGSGSDFENIMGFAIAAVSGGQMSPAAAIADMRSKLAQYANTPSPV